ncbi:hypothetical protein [Natronorarus salvus]|uniref:hypothetical protein n=1 Tax=Natronorarus salvus TaxID=3117733 RepID=UPI002F26AA7E
MTDADLVRTKLLSEHDDLLRTTAECADRVAAMWDGAYVEDRIEVVPPLSTRLSETGVTDRLPVVLSDAVSVLDESLPAPPVPAPPYVTVTSVGPVLRATLSGSRLVLTIRVFTVDGGRYRRAEEPIEETLRVEFR